MTTIREPDGIATPAMPLIAILDEEGQMTGITCPLNVGVNPHDIEGCEDLLESYFMQVSIRPYSVSSEKIISLLHLMFAHMLQLFCRPAG